jgi:hypothetical protein
MKTDRIEILLVCGFFVRFAVPATVAALANATQPVRSSTSSR